MIESGIRAIAEPRRREILRSLVGSELAAGEIAERFPEVTRPAVSQHLRVLREAGLVSQRRDGTRRLYQARKDRIAQLRAELDEFWGIRLDRLKQAVERRAR